MVQLEHEIASKSTSERKPTGPESVDYFEEETSPILPSDGIKISESDVKHHNVEESPSNSKSSGVEVVNKDSAQEEADDVELGGFFLEDAPSNEIMPPNILELQKQEKIKKLSEKKNVEKLAGIWKMVSLCAAFYGV